MEVEKGSNVYDEFPEDMSENAVQQALHMMAHQKVKADKKWGAMLITAVRINRLIEVVEINSAEYHDSSLYLEILYSWKEGNFSRVDQDHNAIWELQGGTVGRATGILTQAEEQEYIEENFD